jgi:hypothetical protein
MAQDRNEEVRRAWRAYLDVLNAPAERRAEPVWNGTRISTRSSSTFSIQRVKLLDEIWTGRILKTVGIALKLTLTSKRERRLAYGPKEPPEKAAAGKIACPTTMAK